METIDEELTINYNMSTHGFEMVFGWGYGLTSKKPSDDTSREARPSVCGFPH